jgi:hypothetical protein
MSFELNDINYYTREADANYMSCSQFQDFQRCEAATIAKMRGIWKPSKESDALFQGRYFHSAMESKKAFDAFCEENFDKIFKTKTTKARGTEIVGKYAPFETLDGCLNVMKNDPLFSRLIALPGHNELFMTGNLGGVRWRMKMDKYISAGRQIIDYKTSSNLWEIHFNVQTRERQSFIEEYGYMMRAAVYGEIERQNANAETFPTFLILAVTKQDPPDRDIFMLNDDARWNLELEKVKAKIPHIQRLKEGNENPRRCGLCEYCRYTKILRKIKMYTDLMPEFRNDPDNMEYDDYGGTSVFDTL